MKAQRCFALITLPRRIGRCNDGDGDGGRVAGAVRTTDRAVSQRPMRAPESRDDIAAGRAPAGPV
jgi:hypothetical protein